MVPNTFLIFKQTLYFTGDSESTLLSRPRIMPGKARDYPTPPDEASKRTNARTVCCRKKTLDKINGHTDGFGDPFAG